MSYPWFKALHVAAIVIWIGGMLVMGLVLSNLIASPGSRSPENLRLAAAIGRWDGRITVPAMLLAWIFGITMALNAGWLASLWLLVKLAFVLALTILHGLEAGALRAWERDPERSLPMFLRHSPSMTITAMAAIAILAIVKPF